MMDILNNNVDILDSLEIADSKKIIYGYIQYSDGGQQPALIIKSGHPLNPKIESFYIDEKEFKKFIASLYLQIDNREVQKKENKLMGIKDNIFNGEKS